MSVLYYFHRFDAFLHIFGEMRGRRILKKISRISLKRCPKSAHVFCPKTAPKKKMDIYFTYILESFHQDSYGFQNLISNWGVGVMNFKNTIAR